MDWKVATRVVAVLAFAVIVAACGGGGADGPSNKVSITSMVSFGDSLSDLGTYNVGSIAGLGAATATLIAASACSAARSDSSPPH